MGGSLFCQIGSKVVFSWAIRTFQLKLEISKHAYFVPWTPTAHIPVTVKMQKEDNQD